MCFMCLRRAVIVEGFAPFMADSALGMPGGKVLFLVNQETESIALCVGNNVEARKLNGLFHYTPNGLTYVSVAHICGPMGDFIWSGQGIYALDDMGWWVRIDTNLDATTTEIFRRACLNSEWATMAETALHLMTKDEIIGFHDGRWRVMGSASAHHLLRSARKVTVPEMGLEAQL